ncbi:hypothetical protein L2E69_07355 [Planktothrix agardhii 1806]|uniref:hypothetical protein n=1 Tax=Planktothrix agardhii TaxID=1160 RepID=UPI001D0B013B|nr:hypothetical protein [Planktothrix agardhii]MCB8762161.1 hypothetical protein [Planktothrix agardhii 1813]MCF3569105.1 hypothetical protein [Planktothrix agardhii 1807]MCF3570487.1 hypothetical protein [Planktothrix agardhii 1805]MCF3603330.1 hypothetical protein [Planktothrix agardhii 1804]MCF3615762.1 hypothetical protein [Planktothrix agardhii 1806]
MTPEFYELICVSNFILLLNAIAIRVGIENCDRFLDMGWVRNLVFNESWFFVRELLGKTRFFS